MLSDVTNITLRFYPKECAQIFLGFVCSPSISGCVCQQVPVEKTLDKRYPKINKKKEGIFSITRATERAKSVG